MAEVSVVVPVAGRHEHLRRCLASIADQCATSEVEVVVVDMTDGDPSLGELGDRSSGSFELRVVPCPPTPQGWLRIAESRNIGAAVASSERLVFLDVDVVLSPGSLESWTASIDTFSNALLAPPVRYLHEGWVHAVDPARPVGGSTWWAASSAAARPTPETERVATSGEFDLFWSVAFCCSLAAFERVGGFDTTYVGYGAEDTDFARRARDLRVALIWLSRGVVFHQHHPPTRHDPASLEAIIRNARRFRRRWGDWPMPEWLAELRSQQLIRWDRNGDEISLLSPAAAP